MSAPELIVMNGVPCAGKSTISRTYKAAETEIKVRHLPMGERLRGIASGQIASRYATELVDDNTNLKNHTQVHNPNLPIYVFEEFINQEPADVVILDGFPRYPDRLDGFKQSIKDIGSNLLAICEVSIPEAAVLIRNGTREDRYKDVEENEAFIQKRLAEYKAGPAVVMEALALDYPYYHMDGMQPIETNVESLKEIFLAHSDRAQMP